MFHTQAFGTILYFAIIIFNLTTVYRVITSKSQVSVNVLTKITINRTKY